MGYKLYREIRDNAPADWTHAERLVALMIADDANDQTRRSWIKLPELMARTGIRSQSGVRQALQKLAVHGYEFRVPIAKGRDGRPVFAAAGHSLDYLVPTMPEKRLNPAPFAKGDSDERPIGPKGDSDESPLSSAKPSLLIGPQDLASRRARAKRERANRSLDEIIEQTRQAVADYYDRADWKNLTDGDFAGLYFTLVEDRKPRSIRAYLSKIFGETPQLDTHLVNVEAICLTCEQWDSDCRCPAA
jgi:hypothetical protein